MGESCLLPVLDGVAPAARSKPLETFFQGRRNKVQKLLDPENVKRAIRTAGKEALQDKEKKGWFYS